MFPPITSSRLRIREPITTVLIGANDSVASDLPICPRGSDVKDVPAKQWQQIFLKSCTVDA